MYPFLPYQASAFNASYSDGGLFGCYVIAEAAIAPQVIMMICVVLILSYFCLFTNQLVPL